jgi:hypothetical protein
LYSLASSTLNIASSLALSAGCSSFHKLPSSPPPSFGGLPARRIPALFYCHLAPPPFLVSVSSRFRPSLSWSSASIAFPPCYPVVQLSLSVVLSLLCSPLLAFVRRHQHKCLHPFEHRLWQDGTRRTIRTARVAAL